MEKLAQHIEALVFATDTPVSKNDILECLEQTFETPFSEEDVSEAIEQVKERYAQEDFAIELVQISGGFQFMTKGAYHGVIASWLKMTTNKRLSKAALETLSIIAYKQPVTKTECEAIRGVSCDYSLQKLLEKELVSIVGRSDGPGRPLLYGTSEKFMDYFGLKDLTDLPKPKDFKEPDSEIGEVSIEEKVEGQPMAALMEGENSGEEKEPEEMENDGEAENSPVSETADEEVTETFSEEKKTEENEEPQILPEAENETPPETIFEEEE